MDVCVCVCVLPISIQWFVYMCTELVLKFLEVFFGVFLHESLLDTAMFIACMHSCLDLIPLKNTSDLISNPEITVRSAHRNLPRAIPQEERYEVWLP